MSDTELCLQLVEAGARHQSCLESVKPGQTLPPTEAELSRAMQVEMLQIMMMNFRRQRQVFFCEEMECL